jgi:hypothetical protein
MEKGKSLLLNNAKKLDIHMPMNEITPLCSNIYTKESKID